MVMSRIKRVKPPPITTKQISNLDLLAKDQKNDLYVTVAVLKSVPF
jgi:hypothetical protein